MFTGMLANGLIVIVNAIDLITQRKIAPLNLLLCCLATSRIILQLCIFFAHLGLFCLVKHNLFTDNFTLFFFVNELSLWFATWLGVFYFVKIATISHPAFLWLKMRIYRLVPWFILGSVLYATISTIIYERDILTFPEKIIISMLSKNATQVGKMDAMTLSVFIFELTLPSLIFIVAVLLLIFSLWNHSWRMRTMVGTREPRRHAHISAMLSILSFFILYFSHYMVGLVIASQSLELGSTTFLLCFLVFGIYPSLHSIILIFGNPRLKQSVKMFIVNCKYCDKMRNTWPSRKEARLSINNVLDIPIIVLLKSETQTLPRGSVCGMD
ncbi:taste receptor type 2 member 17, partial [Sigmodon hispidus]